MRRILDERMADDWELGGLVWWVYVFRTQSAKTALRSDILTRRG